jgi:hypothetical protein
MSGVVALDMKETTKARKGHEDAKKNREYSLVTFSSSVGFFGSV